jgi:hypothetical protein
MATLFNDSQVYQIFSQSSVREEFLQESLSFTLGQCLKSLPKNLRRGFDGSHFEILSTIGEVAMLGSIR